MCLTALQSRAAAMSYEGDEEKLTTSYRTGGRQVQVTEKGEGERGRVKEKLTGIPQTESYH